MKRIAFDLDETLGGPSAQLARVTKRVATLVGRLAKAAQNGDVRAIEASVREAAALRVEEPLGAVQEALGAFDVRGYLESAFPADFVAACQPVRCRVVGAFTPRGGITTTVTCIHEAERHVEPRGSQR